MAESRSATRAGSRVRPARSRSTPPAWPRSTCSRRSASTTPTPTWCCPRCCAQHGLTGRDAAFVTELASGTIRRQGTYDAILAACVDRPLSKVEAKVLDALRLGTHQLLSMRVPGHAAISTTVDLVRAKVGLRRGRVRQRRAAPGRPSRS